MLMTKYKDIAWLLRIRSYESGYTQFADMAEYNPKAKLLDIGCSTGIRTMEIAKKIGTSDIIGIDAKNTSELFRVIKQNIDEGLPFPDNVFDVVVMHHIIEHVSDTDTLISEAYRVLKLGGYIMVGTPNLASGKTIVALILDRQPHDTFISDYFIIGSRLRDNLKHPDRYDWSESKGFLHRRLFTMEGLKELLIHYGFKIEYEKRIGYGRFFFGELLKGRYAANLIVKARKET